MRGQCEIASIISFMKLEKSDRSQAILLDNMYIQKMSKCVTPKNGGIHVKLYTVMLIEIFVC